LILGSSLSPIAPKSRPTLFFLFLNFALSLPFTLLLLSLFLCLYQVIPEYEDLVWPTCASHLGLSTSLRYSDWYSWSWASGYMPHGPVHSWVGGVGGGDAEATYDAMLDEGLITESQARQLKVSKLW